MQLLWIILRWLFPNDPVRQCAGALQQQVTYLVRETFSANGLHTLAHCPEARMYLESMIIDYESALHLAIGGRACQIAKMRFRMRKGSGLYRPRRAKSLPELLARIRNLVAMLANLEYLARLRAAKLMRERDADPLGLVAHGSPSALNGAWLRHAAHHEAFGVASVCTSAGSGLMVSSTQSVRPSNHEAVLTARATSPRAPPVFDVYPNRKPASQPPARSHPHAPPRQFPRKSPFRPNSRRATALFGCDNLTLRDEPHRRPHRWGHTCRTRSASYSQRCSSAA